MKTLLYRGRAVLVGLFLATLLLGVVPARSTEAANERWCPRQAAPYCAENAFLDFWRTVDQTTGGYALDIIGFPISPTLQAPDGLIVQFYERAVFEWHPENPVQYQVLLTQLGRLAIDTDTRLGLKQQMGQPPEPCPSTNECWVANKTNHTLRGTFFSFYTFGLGEPAFNLGLQVFGYPLTEQFQLRYSDGKIYTVQYFERNRFEAHPENTNPRYQVLLGRLGAEVLAANIDTVKTWRVVRTPNYGETQ